MMTFSKKLCGMAGAAGLSLFAALPAWAQEAAEAAPAGAPLLNFSALLFVAPHAKPVLTRH